MLLTILYALTLLPFATFFGIAVYTFIAPIYDKLSPAAFIEFFQKVDPYMKVWARALVLSEVVLTLLILGLQHDRLLSAQGILTGVAFLCGVASMVLAVKGNVPLNRQMDQWDPQAPPANWKEVRDLWLKYHHLRGVCEITGFLALLGAAFAHVSQAG